MKEKEILLALTAKAEKIRGSILNEITFLEKLMDGILTMYFCNTDLKRDEFFELISSERLNFESKRHIVDYIISHHYKEFYEKNKTTLKFLESLPGKRNVIAHYMIGTSNNSIDKFKKENVIIFKRFYGQKQDVLYTDEILNNLIEQIIECSKMFIEFQKIV